MKILISLAPWLFALLYLGWWLSPWSVKRVERGAGRNLVRAWYPRVSQGGNNPLSQRTHEAGGGRFFAVLWTPVLIGIAVFVPEIETRLDPDNPHMQPWVLAPLIGLGAQVLSIPIGFFATRRWNDIAEHGAEGMHGDAALEAGSLHPDALEWLRGDDDDDERPAFGTYSEGEAWRMTRPDQEYGKLQPPEFLKKQRQRRWTSRAMLWLSQIDWKAE